ncbi:MAG: ATP-binding protein [Planctomycetota bacterium]
MSLSVRICSALARVSRVFVLPRTISEFERSYLDRINRVALLCFYAHLPVFVAIGHLNGTGAALALGLTLAVLVGPTLAYRYAESPRTTSVVSGFAAMCLGGVLVHLGQGPVQIEMHFYFLAAIAILAVFANPAAILTAGATVVAHHLLLWWLMPQSVFNYDAPLWVVLVHALFVGIESVAVCFVARTYFDSVVGLERLVDDRTSELAKRNDELHLVLDHVGEGFVTVTSDGVMQSRHSAIVEEWFGPYDDGETFAAFLDRIEPPIGSWFEMGLEQLVSDFLPLELALDQLPTELDHDGRRFRLDYSPITDDDGKLESLLVRIADCTADHEMAEVEARQRRTLVAFERILADRPGFLEFMDEVRALLDTAVEEKDVDWVAAARRIHTLKGNFSAYGFVRLARSCHEIEDHLANGDTDRAARELEALVGDWGTLEATVARFSGALDESSVTISGEEFAELVLDVARGMPRSRIVRRLTDLRRERTHTRLARYVEVARGLAQRLGKGEIDVRIAGEDLHLEREVFARFWSALVHVVRNAVDHGIEPVDVRRAAGKPPRGTIELATHLVGDEFVVSVRDDGAGIDWEAIRAKAAELGLPSDDASLFDAVFADRVTSRSDVNEVSGRGIGLAASRESCASLGGRVEIRSERGRGTEFRFVFPARAMTEFPLAA